MTDDLLARLEAATEGSRELDAEIAAALFILPASKQAWMERWPPHLCVARPDIKPGTVALNNTTGQTSIHWSAEPYTTSIDAALMLVPEGWEWCILSGGVARLWRDAPDLGEVCKSLADGFVPRGPAEKVTGAADSGQPPLALTIAALIRARRAA